METQKREFSDQLQFGRFDSKSAFVEVSGDALTISKIRLGFRAYDVGAEKGARTTRSIDIFVDAEEAAYLGNEILSGKLASVIDANVRAAAAKGPDAFAAPGYLTMGGTSARSLAARGKARPDGRSLSRQMVIEQGRKCSFVISAMSGPGQEDEKGLIVPQYTRKTAEQLIMIPMTAETLKKLALDLNRLVSAYSFGQYMLGDEAFMTAFASKLLAGMDKARAAARPSSVGGA